MRSKTFIQLVGLLLMLAVSSCQPKRRHLGETVPAFSGADTTQVDVVLAGLTLDEKIGQLILWDAPMQDSLSQAQVYQETSAGLVGGVLLRNVHLATFIYAVDSLRRSTKLPLFIATDQKVALNNQFTGVQKFPLPTSVAAIDSAALQVFFEKKFASDCKALGINLALSPTLRTDNSALKPFDFQTFEDDEDALNLRFERMFEVLQSNRILAVADNFSEFKFIENDSIRRVALHRYLTKTNNGLGGLLVDNQALKLDTLSSLPPAYVRNYLSRYLNFKGLMVMKLGENELPEKMLLAGTELLITADVESVFAATHKLLKSGKISELELNRRVRRVLLAKAWVNGGRLPVRLSIVPHDNVTHQPVKFVSISEKRSPEIVREHRPRPSNLDAKVDKTVCYFEDPRWDFFIEKLFESSVILARDDGANLPFKKILDTDYQVFKYSNRAFRDFESLIGKYANYRVVERPISASGDLLPLVLEKTSKVPAAIILLDNIDLQPGFHRQFIESVNSLSSQSQVVVLNFGNPKNLHLFGQDVSCVQIFEKNSFTEKYAAQLLFGGVMSVGKLPVSVDENLIYGTSIRHKPVRLAYGVASNVGIADESLEGINAIAETAIENGVFPGCQVVVAKDGEVIFSKSFGHFTYNKKAQEVKNTDLYDIASMTKVSATTLVVMKLVQTKQLDLEGKVSDYITVPTGSAIGNIKIKQLLLHQSGLQAQMPLSRFFSGKNVPAKGCNNYFCRKRKGGYSVKVADGLYFRQTFQDTILKRVFNLPVVSKPKFRYSDVNFYLLKRIVEAKTKTPMDEYVFENIYRPLGLRNIAFNPLEKFPKSRIAPTEQDNYWRKTLVQGYVHDPCVALLGGVGGSAGIFSNAEDLAALFQMLLNDGAYGGLRFYDRSTVEDFVTNKYTNHRGLGFDKPTKRRYPAYSSKASPKTFGHTGFTGTCVWVDPDQHLVYVFLSNRVNPSSRNGKIFTENVRNLIHEVVYSALGSFDDSLPELDIEEENIEMEEGAGG
ncbi:MAG: serine hydrolase [Saprospiraceae bacterium]|nr:serine hydrolase [Saprospiraceae bacterium]MCF8248320.1 serine hydrolase [Saprospiraceae bacterium]MCF8280241.1 serine hydrolase [Bacteroidales bacterium]MCF8309848.1 serine hydrolase [Saprospiraceae bacterium]MCF8438821.1 serine hydrolase [Saprospiraceae bacterium]